MREALRWCCFVGGILLSAGLWVFQPQPFWRNFVENPPPIIQYPLDALAVAFWAFVLFAVIRSRFVQRPAGEVPVNRDLQLILTIVVVSWVLINRLFVSPWLDGHPWPEARAEVLVAYVAAGFLIVKLALKFQPKPMIVEDSGPSH